MTVDGRIENGQIILNQEIRLPEGMKIRVELSLRNQSSNLPKKQPQRSFRRYMSG